MTPTAAAEIYRTVKPKVEELASELKQLAEAEKVLKDYAKANPDKRSFRRIGFSRGSQNRFSQTLAKQLLGKRAEKCMASIDTVSLTLL